jgi:hypothetical protein
LLHNHPHISSGAGKIGQKWPQYKGLSGVGLSIKKIAVICDVLYKSLISVTVYSKHYKKQTPDSSTQHTLHSNTTDIIKTPATSDYDGGLQHKKLPPQQEHSRQPQPTNQTKPQVTSDFQ